MIEFTEVVVALHSKNVVHGDLRPKNVMITKEGKLYLLDFGNLSINYGQDQSFCTTKLYIPFYCPPEGVIDYDDDQNSSEKNPKFDVWSLGVIMFELFRGVAVKSKIKLGLRFSSISTLKSVSAL